MHYQIPNELSRIEGIASAQPERVNPMRAAAQALTRRGLAEAKTEIANHALAAMVEVLFDIDADGIMSNVDRDGRILLPKPWGKTGFASWGMRVTEARALNAILRRRSNIESAPLFVYDADARDWLVGRSYDTKRKASTYLRNVPITLAEWRLGWEDTKSVWARQNMGNG